MNPVPARAGRHHSKVSSSNVMINMHTPKFCDTLSLSAGRARSFNPAATSPHFINGAQKNTVFGPTVLNNMNLTNKCCIIIPAGWFTKAENFEVAAEVAAPDILKRDGDTDLKY